MSWKQLSKIPEKIKERKQRRLQMSKTLSTLPDLKTEWEAKGINQGATKMSKKIWKAIWCLMPFDAIFYIWQPTFWPWKSRLVDWSCSNPKADSLIEPSSDEKMQLFCIFSGFCVGYFQAACEARDMKSWRPLAPSCDMKKVRKEAPKGRTISNPLEKKTQQNLL